MVISNLILICVIAIKLGISGWLVGAIIAIGMVFDFLFTIHEKSRDRE